MATGLTVLGNTGSGTLTLDASTYNFGGGLTVGPNYSSSGSNISTFTTAGDVSFLGTVELDGTFSIDGGGGDISIAGNITSTGEDEILTLKDGDGSSRTGTITLGGTVSASNITLVGDSGIILGVILQVYLLVQQELLVLQGQLLLQIHRLIVSPLMLISMRIQQLHLMAQQQLMLQQVEANL